MMSFIALQHAYIEAERRKHEAELADRANPYFDHERHYSQAYARAYRHWLDVYWQWRVVYEEVCFPLTAIGVLYDPDLDLLRDEEDVPTVKLAAIKIGTVKLPIVEFPKIAA